MRLVFYALDTKLPFFNQKKLNFDYNLEWWFWCYGQSKVWEIPPIVSESDIIEKLDFWKDYGMSGIAPTPYTISKKTIPNAIFVIHYENEALIFT